MKLMFSLLLLGESPHMENSADSIL